MLKNGQSVTVTTRFAAPPSSATSIVIIDSFAHTSPLFHTFQTLSKHSKHSKLSKWSQTPKAVPSTRRPNAMR